MGREKYIVLYNGPWFKTRCLPRSMVLNPLPVQPLVKSKICKKGRSKIRRIGRNKSRRRGRRRSGSPRACLPVSHLARQPPKHAGYTHHLDWRIGFSQFDSLQRVSNQFCIICLDSLDFLVTCMFSSNFTVIDQHEYKQSLTSFVQINMNMNKVCVQNLVLDQIQQTSFIE